MPISTITDYLTEVNLIELKKGVLEDSTVTLQTALDFFRVEVNRVASENPTYDVRATMLDRRTTQVAIDENAGRGNIYNIYSDAYVVKYNMDNWWDLSLDTVGVNSVLDLNKKANTVFEYFPDTGFVRLTCGSYYANKTIELRHHRDGSIYDLKLYTADANGIVEFDWANTLSDSDYGNMFHAEFYYHETSVDVNGIRTIVEHDLGKFGFYPTDTQRIFYQSEFTDVLGNVDGSLEMVLDVNGDHSDLAIYEYNPNGDDVYLANSQSNTLFTIKPTGSYPNKYVGSISVYSEYFGHKTTPREFNFSIPLLPFLFDSSTATLTDGTNVTLNSTASNTVTITLDSFTVYDLTDGSASSTVTVTSGSGSASGSIASTTFLTDSYSIVDLGSKLFSIDSTGTETEIPVISVTFNVLSDSSVSTTFTLATDFKFDADFDYDFQIHAVLSSTNNTNTLMIDGFTSTRNRLRIDHNTSSIASPIIDSAYSKFVTDQTIVSVPNTLTASPTLTTQFVSGYDNITSIMSLKNITGNVPQLLVIINGITNAFEDNSLFSSAVTPVTWNSDQLLLDTAGNVLAINGTSSVNIIDNGDGSYSTYILVYHNWALSQYTPLDGTDTTLRWNLNLSQTDANGVVRSVFAPSTHALITPTSAPVIQ